MMILLEAYSDHTNVAANEAQRFILRVGMRFVEAHVPRSLDEDRRFVSRLSETDWDGVRLCGVEAPADIEKASALLRVAEANRAMPDGSLPILAVLDTARAALALDRFDRTISRLAAFIFEPDALARAAGAAADSGLVADLRLRLPLVARTCGVAALLTVGTSDPDASAKARRDGYDGLCLKQA